MATRNRFGPKVETNREHYKDSDERMKAWIKWAQTHENRFESYSEWCDLPYENPS